MVHTLPMRSLAHLLSSTLAVILWLAMPQYANSADLGEPTDLNLVIAVDSSYSVDADEYALQISGLSAVFADPAIARAIEGGPRGRIGVLLVQWSSREAQFVSLPWSVLSGAGDTARYSAAVAPVERATIDPGTAIASALEFSHSQLKSAPFPADRNVIDIIADGKDGYRRPVPPVRDLITAQNVTINALAIRNQVRDLHDYLYKNVVGGDGAFVEDAASYESFAPAFKRKLLREIRGEGLAALSRAKSGVLR